MHSLALPQANPPDDSQKDLDMNAHDSIDPGPTARSALRGGADRGRPGLRPETWRQLGVRLQPLAICRAGTPGDNAIHAFARYVAAQHPEHLETCQRLDTHGVLVVHSHSTSEFERGESVGDLDYYLVKSIQELTNAFLARISLQVKKQRVGPSPENQPWRAPQAERLHVYRKI